MPKPQPRKRPMGVTIGLKRWSVWRFIPARLTRI